MNRVHLPPAAWAYIPRRVRRALWDGLPLTETQRDHLRAFFRLGVKPTSPGLPLAQRVAAYNWFQSIDLGSGIITLGKKTLEDHAIEAASFFDGIDLKGKTFIDVGACNGAYSAEAKKRGASRVVAADVWRYPRMGTRANIELVSQALGLPIETMYLDIEQPLPPRIGRFDVVLFAGVFYHLLDPIAGLRRAADLARDLLIVETHVISEFEKPAMVFYPGDELDGDGSNWWGPNVACMTALLKTIGFKRVQASKSHAGRATFHAWWSA
jgi:tRNA (mo5U34)-methyltransferase